MTNLGDLSSPRRKRCGGGKSKKVVEDFHLPGETDKKIKMNSCRSLKPTLEGSKRLWEEKKASLWPRGILFVCAETHLGRRCHIERWDQKPFSEMKKVNYFFISTFSLSLAPARLVFANRDETGNCNTRKARREKRREKVELLIVFKLKKHEVCIWAELWFGLRALNLISDVNHQSAEKFRDSDSSIKRISRHFQFHLL